MTNKSIVKRHVLWTIFGYTFTQQSTASVTFIIITRGTVISRVMIIDLKSFTKYYIVLSGLALTGCNASKFKLILLYINRSCQALWWLNGSASSSIFLENQKTLLPWIHNCTQWHCVSSFICLLLCLLLLHMQAYAVVLTMCEVLFIGSKKNT